MLIEKRVNYAYRAESWYSAQAFCSSRGGMLPIPKFRHELNFLTTNQASYMFFLGIENVS